MCGVCLCEFVYTLLLLVSVARFLGIVSATWAHPEWPPCYCFLWSSVARCVYPTFASYLLCALGQTHVCEPPFSSPSRSPLWEKQTQNLTHRVLSMEQP